MNRFALTPPPRTGSSAEPFAAQLALSRVHPCLVALERTPGGYAIPRDATRGWFELRAKRGLAGYGLARALRMLLDVLAGLSALEDTRRQAGRPFVHGELVPAMVRVDPSGIARLIPLAPWHWSEPGTLPAPERCGHLAPERLLGDVLDARADVFSAGVLLWEALAGRRLFEGESVDGIVTRLMGEKVILPQLPPELSWAVPLKAVAMRALSVDPRQRFANAAELAEAIEAVASNRLATHAELASYFSAPAPSAPAPSAPTPSAPTPSARPSVIARPPSLPAHHSSLSALVAPVQQPAPDESSSPESASSESSLPQGGPTRPTWAIAAICCLLGAFGGSAVARHMAAQGAAHGAAQGASPLAETRPAAPPLLSARPVPPAPASASAPDTPPAPASDSPPDPASAGPVAVPVQPVPVASTALPSERNDPTAKPPKIPAARKEPMPKVRAPAKAVRFPERTATKYGI